MRRNVLLLAACQALMMSGNSLIIATSALVGASLADNPGWATSPLALQYLGLMLSTYWASMLMKHIGRSAGFGIGLVIGIAGGVFATLGILAGSIGGFALGSFLVGVFNGFGQYYRFAAADVATPQYRSRAISYVMAGGIVAAVVGPNLASLSRDWLSVAFAGSYASLVALYLLSVVCLAWARIPRPGADERRKGGRPLAEITTQPAFLVAVIGAMMGYGVMNLVMTATPLAMAHHGLPFEDTAFVIQWHVLGMFVPSFFTGALIARFGVTRVMLSGAISLAACVGVNLAGETIVHFWAALVLLGIGWNFLFIGGTTLLTESFRPEEKAKTQGINDFLVFSMVGITALSSGWIQHAFGWRVVNLMVIVPIVVAFAVALWYDRRMAAARMAAG
jgi:MFS family permease